MKSTSKTAGMAGWMVATLAMMCHASFAATLPQPMGAGNAGNLPEACATLLAGTQKEATRHAGRIRCVISGDTGAVRNPLALGAPVAWDRVIIDPAALHNMASRQA